MTKRDSGDRGSSLAFFAELEKELVEKERDAAQGAEERKAAARRDQRKRLEVEEKAVKEREQSRSDSLAKELAQAYRQRLDSELGSLKTIEEKFLKHKREGVEDGLAWLLGEQAGD